MKILKAGEPCPCCGQPIPADCPAETRLLLSWIALGMELYHITKEVEDNADKFKRGRSQKTF